jgi:hypothetical protein
MEQVQDETLYTMGGCAGMLVGIVTVGSVGVMVFKGVEWYNNAILPWLVGTVPILFLVDLSLTLLAIYRPARKVAGGLIFGISHAAMAITWLLSLVMCYSTGKAFAVILGLFLGIVGVVPVALLGCLTHHYWTEFMMILVCAAFGVGSRVLGYFIVGTSLK